MAETGGSRASSLADLNSIEDWTVEMNLLWVLQNMYIILLIFWIYDSVQFENSTNSRKTWFIIHYSQFYLCTLLCGSCHLDRLLDVEIGVEYWMIFVVLFFNVPVKFILGNLQDLEKIVWFHYKTCSAIRSFFDTAEN